MSEEKKDYTRIIKRARRRRKRANYLHIAGIAVILLLLVLCVLFLWKKGGFPASSGKSEGVAIATDSDAEARRAEAAETTAGDAGDQDVHIEEAEKHGKF